MTEWFGSHTWLRRGDIGVGHDLYTRLASPKQLITSFRITIVTTLLEIQKAKKALIEFFIDNKWSVHDIPYLKNRNEYDGSMDYNAYHCQYFANVMSRLQQDYQNYKGEYSFDLAIKAIIYENVQNHSQDRISSCFQQNTKIICSHKRQFANVTSVKNTLFSFDFLRALIVCSNNSELDKRQVPTCKAEEIIFNWLMAYQTVQPSDIQKLTSKDFKFIKRRNGEITHIDLAYFKGRAGVVHSVKTLETKTDLGEAVLNYLNNKKNFETESNKVAAEFYLGTGNGAPVHKIFNFANKWLRNTINKKLSSEKASDVFLDSIISLLNNGIRYDKNKHVTTKYFRENIDTPLKKNCFSLTTIKNSSIHSRSDTFSPTQLLNYHSHTNETERVSYLSPQNEEWLNNCGRITRAVMQDLTVNLFRASEKEKRVFNSEFTRSAEIIDLKRDDIISRMKVITGKENGKVNEFGFMVKKEHDKIEDEYDTIFFVDSAETVLKLKHYLSEVKLKYNRLIENAEEYFLFTVLPTTEWIEILFEQKKFSKKSLAEGEYLYETYKDNLPPLFKSQMGC